MIEEEEEGEGKLVVPPVLHRQSVTNTLDHDGMGKMGWVSSLATTLSENATVCYYLPIVDDYIDDCTAVCSSCYSLFCL